MKIAYFHSEDSGSCLSQKARFLCQRFPLYVPSFGNEYKRSDPVRVALGVAERELDEVGMGDPWVIIGSSLGGLVAALLASKRPDLVLGLVLLGPAFNRPETEEIHRIPVYTTVFHGRNDTRVPYQHSDAFMQRFPEHWHHETLNFVDDDQHLYQTVNAIARVTIGTVRALLVDQMGPSWIK